MGYYDYPNLTGILFVRESHSLNSQAVNLIMRSLSVASRRAESIANRSNTIREEVTGFMGLNTTSIGIANWARPNALQI